MATFVSYRSPRNFTPDERNRLARPLSSISGKNQVALGGVGGDPGPCRTPKHVYLAPDPELPVR
jgi:hypothetical protein